MWRQLLGKIKLQLVIMLQGLFIIAVADIIGGLAALWWKVLTICWLSSHPLHFSVLWITVSGFLVGELASFVDNL